MKENLIRRLHEYLKANNPDLLVQLKEDSLVKEYLLAKVNSVKALIHQNERKQRPCSNDIDACMDILTQDLRPSRYNYIRIILEEDFGKINTQLIGSGLLQLEVINMISYCNSVFEDLNFSEANKGNRFTRYAISGTIAEYLETVKSKYEHVSNELQQSAETERQSGFHPR
jgi:hypothetical protein